MTSDIELSVSIIVPVRGRGDKFAQCMNSVAKCSPAPAEIIVVVDGEMDGSRQHAERSGARVIELPVAGGPARARNLGAKKARGDILFFVDADVTVSPDAVEQIIRFFQCNPDVVAVFGSYDDDPDEANFISQYKNLLHHYVHQSSSEEASTFWGACGAIRRDVFLEVGGFDESYRRPAIEDIALGSRLRKTGHRIRTLKNLQVKHLKRWGIVSLLKTDFFDRALPWTDLILKESGFINELNLKMSSRVSVALVGLLPLTLMAALFSPWFLASSAVCTIALLYLNWDLYRFFGEKRGFSFAVMAIPWHWLYLFYGGLGFLIGFMLHYAGKLRTDEPHGSAEGIETMDPGNPQMP